MKDWKVVFIFRENFFGSNQTGCRLFRAQVNKKVKIEYFVKDIFAE